MADEKPKKPSSSSDGGADPILQFLDQLTTLPGMILEGMLNQASDEDEKTVINNLAQPLGTQFRELATFVGDESRRLSRQNRSDAEQVLRISAAGELIAGGSEVSRNLASPVARIGLAGIVTEIKKIIRILLEAFGIRLPKWLDAIFNLIDEIVNLLFSTGLPRLGRTLSSMEQDFLAELTHLTRLQRETDLRFDGFEDEDT